MLLTDPNGTITDGSGSAYYANNANCKWIIAPTGAIQITLTFTWLFTDQGHDIVRVYQCGQVECQTTLLLAELSGYLAKAYTVTATTGYMLVLFTSDSFLASDGWTASWTSVSPLYYHQTMTQSVETRSLWR
jgi:hypothetical protein